MAFNYKSETREAYRSTTVASKYHTTVKGRLNWRVLPARLVAARERRIVLRLLSELPHGQVLDIPTGTGKLAPIFARLGSDVLALDISEEMLAIAKTSFHEVGHESVRFGICDAEEVAERFPGPYEVCVCLRLLHRVPTEVKQRILANLSSIGQFAVVSFGVRLWYEPARAALRQALFDAPPLKNFEEKLDHLLEILSPYFQVLQVKRVLPGLSREIVFLLRSMHYRKN